MKILVISNVFLPGINGGGPIKSLKNLIDYLEDDYEFSVITESRDVGSKKRYKNIIINSWNKFKRYKVKYIDKFTIKRVNKDINIVVPDIIYLNSFFARASFVTYLLIPKYKNIIFIIAPRGELNSNALNLKAEKKRIFIRLLQKSSLLKKVRFHATSEEEKKDILSLFPHNKVTVIPNLPSIASSENLRTCKERNSLRIVSVSRISKMKNIDFSIKSLNGITEGEIVFDLFGPIEDKTYHEECLREIEKLNSNIKVNFKGSLNNSEVSEQLRNYDLFYLPTLGENYGHSIVEAIQNQVPVLISSNTPWIKLEEKKIGKDLSLSNIDEFTDFIKSLIPLNDEEYRERFTGFESFIKKELNVATTIEKYKKLFDGKKD